MAIEYLKEILPLRGVSGDEDEVRDYLYNKCQELADKVYIDNLGSVIAIKEGYISPNVSVMGCAHMDEVGFIINGIDNDGYLNFEAIGGFDTRILPSSKVLIGENRIPGIIGILPIHLSKAEERKKAIPMDDLYIDIGATSKEEVLEHVCLGDTVIFDSEIVEFGDNLLKSKALDDRVGCSILLKALEGKYPLTFIAVFSVQEEVGLRGATVAAHRENPDFGIVLEGTTCADMHGVKDANKVTTIRKGAAITLTDRAAVPDRQLRKFIIDIANEYDIKYQDRKGTFGGTDGGALQRARGGIPVAHIATPCRYIHSPVSVMSKDDFECATKIFILSLTNMDRLIDDIEINEEPSEDIVSSSSIIDNINSFENILEIYDKDDD